ncbi:hypothetical protein HYDPIDRAFT_86565 [Hydnomerulius pinastri MD-312]|nr:hypothetical protein HYDPIDRAFT_86565 [Hydnomerulius pinastri MD-312]
MGKEPGGTKLLKQQKHRVSDAPSRPPLTPVNSCTDVLEESPKRDGTFRRLLRKKKKSLGGITPFPTDVEPFPIGLQANVSIDEGSLPSPPVAVEFPSSTDNRSLPPVEVFEARDGFVKLHGMMHHPYPRCDAPYMQAYDQVLMENDRFSESLLRRLNQNKSPSFYNYGNNSPKAILDLGCGAGDWAAEAASFWPNSNVIGFDLVDPTRLRGDSEVPSNVKWTQGNFVKYKLPFPKNTFDFVRMANLSLCVPYQRWEHVLSEVRRVLMQGGRLELIDDHLHFPYARTPPQPPYSPNFISRPRPSSSSFDVGDDDNDEDEAAEAEADEEDNDDDFKSVRTHISVAQPSVVGIEPSPPTFVYDPVAEWTKNVHDSKLLEQLFEDMLWYKFHIHPRPQEIIVETLDRVFGRYNSNKIQDMNLYLAPPNKDSDEASIGSSESGGSAGIKKAGKDFAKWMTTVEWEPRDKEKEKKQRTKGDRSSGESIAINSLPGTINAKAAGRLGIAYCPPRPPQSTQSPGLILWPNTFYPIAPFELEMHANKHTHSLIGWKNALIEYVKDVSGQKNLPVPNTGDYIWDYESFRRKRFNWPSEVPELHTLSSDNVTPRSASFRPSLDAPATGSMTAPLEPLYPRDQLDFLRNIRVYNVIKADEENHLPQP